MRFFSAEPRRYAPALSALATGALLFFITCSLTTTVFDPDLWWHLTVGRWIVAHAEVPAQDYWNLFAHGTPWRAYSWLFESVTALLTGESSESAQILRLFWIQAALAGLVVLSLYTTYVGLSKSRGVGLLLTGTTAIALTTHFSLRPQTVTWIIYTLLLGAAARLMCPKSAKRCRTRSAVTIFLLMIVWSNIHLSAVIGICSLLAWTYSHRASRSEALRCTLLVLALTVPATVITPYLGGEWLTLLETWNHPFIHQGIAEFLPATIFYYGTAVLILLLGLTVLSAHETGNTESVPAIVWAAMLSVGALAVIKFIPFAVIFLAATFARIWGNAATKKNASPIPLTTGIQHLLNLCASLPMPLVSIFALLLGAQRLHLLSKNPLDREMTPRAEVNFIVDKELPGPILNLFGNGGYLIYRFSNQRGEPTQLFPIDGRTNVAPPAIFEAHNQALGGTAGWNSYLDLVHPKVILWRKESPLTSLLMQRHEWCRVYEREPKNQSSGYVVFASADVVTQNSLSPLAPCNASAPEIKNTTIDPIHE